MKNETQIAPKDFAEFELYKYVRFADGEVRFCRNLYTEHKQLKEETDKFPPVSAGVIAVAMKEWRIFDWGSVTLHIPSMKDDEDVIGKVLEPLGYRRRKD